jgi:tetratricopeptide (TPR) repeat protein
MIDFEAALRLAPAYPEAYSNRGSARHAAGDVAGALADCDRALELEPDHAPAAYNRGQARLALGDTAGALADFDRAAARGAPAVVAAAYRGRGDARLAMGDPIGAVAEYTTALVLNPCDPDSYHGRGGARLALGDFAGAIVDCDRALELVPRSCATLITRGNAHYHNCDGAASADYKAAFRLDPDLTTRELVGIVVDHARRAPVAVLEHCRKHLRIDPDDIMSYARRGLTLLLLGREAEAEPDFERMRQMDPEWRPYLALLIEGVRRHFVP